MTRVINLSEYKMKRDMAEFGLSSSDLIDITDKFIESMQVPRSRLRIFKCGGVFWNNQFWNRIGSNKCYKMALVP